MDSSILIDYAKKFLGTPYVYGGDDFAGVDCSGFVSELMRAAGMIGNKERLNAQMLYDKFSYNGTPNVWSAGALAFYGESVVRITHVSFLIDHQTCVEAGGGDSLTVSLPQAIEKNAFVRMRPVRYRKDFVAVIKPRYPWLV